MEKASASKRFLRWLGYDVENSGEPVHEPRKPPFREPKAKPPTPAKTDAQATEVMRPVSAPAPAKPKDPPARPKPAPAPPAPKSEEPKPDPPASSDAAEIEAARRRAGEAEKRADAAQRKLEQVLAERDRHEAEIREQAAQWLRERLADATPQAEPAAPATATDSAGGAGPDPAATAEIERLQALLDEERAAKARVIEESDQRLAELEAKVTRTIERLVAAGSDHDQEPAAGAEEPAAGAEEPAAGAGEPAAGNGAQISIPLAEASFDQLRSLGLSVTQTRRLIRFRDAGDLESVTELGSVPGFPDDLVTRLRERLTD